VSYITKRISKLRTFLSTSSTIVDLLSYPQHPETRDTQHG